MNFKTKLSVIAVALSAMVSADVMAKGVSSSRASFSSARSTVRSYSAPSRPTTPARVTVSKPAPVVTRSPAQVSSYHARTATTGEYRSPTPSTANTFLTSLGGAMAGAMIGNALTSSTAHASESKTVEQPVDKSPSSNNANQPAGNVVGAGYSSNALGGTVASPDVPQMLTQEVAQPATQVQVFSQFVGDKTTQGLIGLTPVYSHWCVSGYQFIGGTVDYPQQMTQVIGVDGLPLRCVVR